ncbi:hypothetical protein PNEG_03543 [Pneumocystis murina B123]|uniref:Rad4 beta-hairpin domain-containing protein n=1 Tax=Pneumocystis murina (strain B123) TaxID=1069680 RepID=M7P2J5_PNEMU|nr:hypothetical protein PNEG_03543 [Pneumocystis murina B123]EMR08105.1 hypothetical protein PNEG_03543 [Pneumocystis murina B123]
MSRLNNVKNIKRNRSDSLSDNEDNLKLSDKIDKKIVYDQTSKYFSKNTSFKTEEFLDDKFESNLLDSCFQDSGESSVDWEDVEIYQKISLKDGDLKDDSLENLDIVLNNQKKSKFKKKVSNINSLKRNIRVQIYLLHLTCLVFHGFFRNKWINDKETHDILRNKLKEESPLLFGKIENYRQILLNKRSDLLNFKKMLLMILKWFKQRFEIIALGIGKLDSYSTKCDFCLKNKACLFETIESIYEFRKIATFLKGSRDSGTQILTSLLRAFGFNARLIFSLQPIGLNFNLEDYEIHKEKCFESKKCSNDKFKNSKKARVGISENELDNTFIKSEENLVDKTELVLDSCFPYPVFWTEVYDENADIWYSVECMTLNCVISSDRSFFIPNTKALNKTKMNVSYIVAFEVDEYAKDVTFRYLNNMSTFSRVKLTTLERDKYTSFEKLVDIFKRPVLSDIDLKENNDLQPKNLSKKIQNITINDYKTHPTYILERHLKRQEVVRPGVSPVYVFMLGKGNKLKEERVFNRSDILLCKSVECYYREGRQIKSGELPLKIVKPRSVTLSRKRENELIAFETNKLAIQPLYAEFQTELYIPPPVVNGIVPKNGYGNIDVFVDSMIPKGATHLPYHGIGRIAKKLGFDYSDAVTGFEFKNQRAIPIITGILIATENASTCFEAWIFDEQKKIEKEIKKREKEILYRWKKFLLGLRIRNRVESLYGNSSNVLSGFIFSKK